MPVRAEGSRQIGLGALVGAVKDHQPSSARSPHAALECHGGWSFAQRVAGVPGVHVHVVRRLDAQGEVSALGPSLTLLVVLRVDPQPGRGCSRVRARAEASLGLLKKSCPFGRCRRRRRRWSGRRRRTDGRTDRARDRFPKSRRGRFEELLPVDRLPKGIELLLEVEAVPSRVPAAALGGGNPRPARALSSVGSPLCTKIKARRKDKTEAA